MKRSQDRILTTHTGSLARPPDLLELMRAREDGQSIDEAAFERRVAEAVADNVRQQVEAGISVVNDGEVGKPSFNAYVLQRLEGFETRVPAAGVAASTGPVDLQGRDAQMFPDYYMPMLEHSPFEHVIRMAPRVCVAPIRYIGHAHVQRDIANLQSALAGLDTAEAFLPSSSPIPTQPNEFYASEEEYFAAYADAMREEYQAILDAGLVLQIDDPRMISGWDSQRNLSLDEYRRLAARRVEVAQLRAARLARGSHPLSHLLQRQFRPAGERSAIGRHRRHPAHASAPVPTPSRPPIRATNTSGASLPMAASCPKARSSSQAWSPTPT